MTFNGCPVFIELRTIIKPVDVYAETETEIISNFVIKVSICKCSYGKEECRNSSSGG